MNFYTWRVKSSDFERFCLDDNGRMASEWQAWERPYLYTARVFEHFRHALDDVMQESLSAYYGLDVYEVVVVGESDKGLEFREPVEPMPFFVHRGLIYRQWTGNVEELGDAIYRLWEKETK